MDTFLVYVIGTIKLYRHNQVHLLYRIKTRLFFFTVLVKKMTAETERLAHCVGSSQDLLRRILADEVKPNLLKFRVFVDEPPGAQISSPFVDDILNECHLTFRSCFHAFYPTGMLKWLCLCDLLQHLEPVSFPL